MGLNGFYTRQAWLLLHPIERAELLLVMEGKKRATLQNATRATWEMAHEASLESKVWNDHVIYARESQDLDAFEDRIKKGEAESDRYPALRATGWLMEYPDCCVAQYAEDTEKEMRWRAQGGQSPYQRNWEFELSLVARRRDPLPHDIDLFDYRLYVPCGLHCEASRPLLTGWRDTLETHDPIAAQALRDKHGLARLLHAWQGRIS